MAIEYEVRRCGDGKNWGVYRNDGLRVGGMFRTRKSAERHRNRLTAKMTNPKAA